MFKRLYSKILSPIGESTAESFWIKRKGIGENYIKNVNHPSKPFLTNILAYYKADPILEVGCASGDNIICLAEKLPTTRIVGVDINQDAVNYGNMMLWQKRLKYTQLVQGMADDLNMCKNGEYELVFTNAVLTHIIPSKIEKVLDEIYRISSRWIVLIEPHLKDGTLTKLAVYHNHQWIRDYVKLLNKYDNKSMKITKIPPELWKGEPWESLGVVIEIEK